MADKITAPDVIESVKIVEEIKKVEKAFTELLAQMKLVTTQSSSFNTQGQGNQILTQRVKLETEASAALKERARLQNALLRQEAKNAQAQSENAKALQKERLETSLLNREQKEDAILKSNIVGAYQKLNLERTKASKTLRDLVASEKASNAEITKAQANFDKLDAKIRKADAAVRDSTKNVGNYKSAFQGVRSVLTGLVGAFGIVEGLRLGIQFAKDSVELARRAKGVEFAFKQLGDTGEDAFDRIKEATRGALSDLDIKTSINEFQQFGIPLERANTLFEFLAVSSSQTGKNIKDLQSSLVEGLSKESLLRIDNLGISAAELNNELEKTPNFVDAVANIAERKLLNAGNILDDAANSTQKWNASWENLTLSIGKAFDNIKGSKEAVGIITALSEQQAALNTSWEESTGAISRLKIQLNILTESGREENRRIVEESESRKKATEEIKKQTIAYVELNKTLAPLERGVKEAFETFDLAGPIRDVNFLNGAISNLNEKLLETSSSDQAKKIQDSIDALENERDAILGSDKGRKDAVKTIYGSIKAYEELITEITNLRDGTATTTEEYKKFDDQIAQTERKINQLKNGIDSLAKIDTTSFGFTASVGVVDSPITRDPLSIQEGITNQIIANKERERAILKSIEERRIADYEGFTKEEIEVLRDANEQSIRLREDREFAIKDLVIGSFDSIFDARIDNIDKQLTANQNFLDEVLNSETKSDEQKQAARIQADKKEQQLLKKREKEEKKAFLVQQGLALAEIAINLARTISAINVAAAAIDAVTFGIGGQVYRASNIPIAITTSAAQAGLVLAQSIPQFFKGTDNAPRGWAWTDEKGPELITDRSGNIKSYGSKDGAKLRWLDGGEKIATAEKTKQIFKESNIYHSRILMNGHSERVEYKARRDDNRLLFEVSSLKDEIRRLGGRPINVENTVKIEQPITRY